MEVEPRDRVRVAGQVAQQLVGHEIPDLQQFRRGPGAQTVGQLLMMTSPRLQWTRGLINDCLLEVLYWRLRIL